MLLKCLVDHQMSQNETAHFTPGEVYDVPDELGRRLLQDFGPGSRHQARHQEVKFQRVAVEGDVVDRMEDGMPVKHVVTAEEAYSGETHKVGVDGAVVTGESGTIDHTHLSTSEPPVQPPYAQEHGEPTLDVMQGEKASSSRGRGKQE